MPLSSQPTQATAKVVRTKSIVTTFSKQYLIAINYEDIDQKAKRRIFAYAKSKRVHNIPRYVTVTVVAPVTLTAFSLTCFLN